MIEIIGFLGILLASGENNKPVSYNINPKKDLENYQTISDELLYKEKQFNLSWQIINNSITKKPIEVQNKLKIICKNHNKSVLVKIKSYADDKVVGTFDCRL